VLLTTGGTTGVLVITGGQGVEETTGGTTG
jgi:hypothetical protein